MRNVIGTIKTVNNVAYAAKALMFMLCDRYGNPKGMITHAPTAAVVPSETCTRGTDTSYQSVPSIVHASTNLSGEFNVWLGVTECGGLGDYYLLSFEEVNGQTLDPIKLYVRAGDTPIAYELLRLPYVGDMSLSELLCDGTINPNLKDLMERFFNGEKLHNANEQRLITNYINYANGYNDRAEMKQVDEGV